VRIESRVIGRSLDQSEKWLSFLDDIGRQLYSLTGSNVLRGVDRSGGDEQHIAGCGLHRFTADLVLPRAFDHIDDFLARMRVAGKDGSWRNFDADLNDFTSG